MGFHSPKVLTDLRYRFSSMITGWCPESKIIEPFGIGELAYISFFHLGEELHFKFKGLESYSNTITSRLNPEAIKYPTAPLSKLECLQRTRHLQILLVQWNHPLMSSFCNQLQNIHHQDP